MAFPGRSRAAIVSATTALLLATTAGTAWPYSHTYGPSPNGGYGRTSGSINHQGQTQFAFTTYLEDLCPADGYGVSFFFQVNHRDGTDFFSDIKGANQLGCGQTTSHWGNIYRNKAIAKSRAGSCWTEGGNLCWAVPLSAYADWVYNNN